MSNKFLHSSDTTDLSTGGVINGDLDLNGFLNLSGNQLINGDLKVSGTVVASTIISNVELEVKDVLITSGVDNPADTSNLGLLNEYTSGGKKWAGLIRSHNDKDYYLLKDKTVKPTPTSDVRPAGGDRTLLGNTHMNQLNCYGVDATGFLRSGGEVVMNTEADIWIIDKDRGTNGQVLTYNSTGNVAEWQDPVPGTLQDVYDYSTAPQIITSVTNPQLVFKQDPSATGVFFEVKDRLNDVKLSASETKVTISELESGDVNAQTITVNNAKLKDALEIERWDFEVGTGDRLNLKNDVGDVQMELTQDGKMKLGKSLTIGNPTTNNYQIEIQSDTNLSGILTQENVNSNSGPTQVFRKSRGTSASPTAILNNDYFAAQTWEGYDGTGYRQGVILQARATENWSASGRGSHLCVRACENGGTSAPERFCIVDGAVRHGDTAAGTHYVFPKVRGNVNQALITDASGVLTWQDTLKGPVTSTDNAIPRFDGTSGDLLQDSSWTISDTDVMNNNAGFSVDGGDVSADHIKLKNSLGIEQWDAGVDATNELELKNATGDVKLSIDQAGNMGINGEANPSAGLLTLYKEAFPCTVYSQCFSNSSTHRSIQVLARARGTKASPAAILNGNWISQQLFRGHDGTSFQHAAEIACIASENWNATSRGSFYRFSTCANGTTSLTERMRITADGRICIGNPVAGTQYYFPPASGTLDQALISDASGNVTWQDTLKGPVASTDNNIPRFDGTSGNVLQDSSWTIEDTGEMRNTTGGVIKIGFPINIPSFGLQIQNDLKVGLSLEQNSTNTSSADIVIAKSRGTGISPTPILVGDVISTKYYNGFDLTAYSSGVIEQVVATENFAPGSNGAWWCLRACANGESSPQERLCVKNGYVGIGNSFLSQDYYFPKVKGLENQVLRLDASGFLQWVTDTSQENSGKYSQTVISSVFGSDGIKSIFDTTGAQGSRVIPANTLKDGDIYRIRAECAYENDANNNGFFCTLVINGVNFSVSPLTVMSVTTNSRFVEIDYDLKYIASSNFLNITTSLKWVDNNNEKQGEKITNEVSSGAVNPNLPITIDVQVQWNNLSILKKLFVRQLTIEKLII